MYSVMSSNNTIQLMYNFMQAYPVALFYFEKYLLYKLAITLHYIK
jgi:hypothetical protein